MSAPSACPARIVKSSAVRITGRPRIFPKPSVQLILMLPVLEKQERLALHIVAGREVSNRFLLLLNH